VATRNAEIKFLKAAGSSQQSAAPATSQSAAAKSIDQMSLRELADAADEAARAGNKAEANRYFLAHAARKPIR